MPRNARTLEKIATEIHDLERKSIFEIGALLIEAKESCEHGDWLDWFANSEFEFSIQTADRYMSVARLAANSSRVRNLKIPASAFYELTKEKPDALPEMIEALAKAGPLSAVEARILIWDVKLRHKWGDYPSETLHALEYLDKRDPWSEAAEKALKKSKPTDEESADKIVDDYHRKHVAELYADHGKLPPVVLRGGLNGLQIHVPDDKRGDVLKELCESGEPVDFEQVMNALNKLRLAAIQADPESSLDPDEEFAPSTVPDDGEFEFEAEDDEAEAEAEADEGRLPSAVATFIDEARTLSRSGFKDIRVSREQAEALQEVVEFLARIVARSRGASVAKSVADRAEARSKLKLVQ